MMRRATEADVSALRAFLEPRIETSMFLLGNLEAHGTDNGDHPHGTAFYLREEDGVITGVLGRANGGFLMCQMPHLSVQQARSCLPLLDGLGLRGMTGEADQVARFLEALPLAAEDWSLNRVEPLYRLDLATLSSTDTVRMPGAADLPLLQTWFAGYLADTRTGTAEDAVSRAAGAVDAEHIRLLLQGGEPVAMAAVNARAGDTVQIGGVYVPPPLRGRGLAGRVVAAQLCALRGAGIRTAILFAASDVAARAYERIGFARVGAYRVALLNGMVRLNTALSGVLS